MRNVIPTREESPLGRHRVSADQHTGRTTEPQRVFAGKRERPKGVNGLSVNRHTDRALSPFPKPLLLCFVFRRSCTSCSGAGSGTLGRPRASSTARPECVLGRNTPPPTVQHSPRSPTCSPIHSSTSSHPLNSPLLQTLILLSSLSSLPQTSLSPNGP